MNFRPHPLSDVERRIAQALEADAQLRSLFHYNRSIETVRGSHPRVDLFWPEGCLVVELDGYADHSRREAFAADRHRDYELALSGYTVLRLANEEVLRDVEKAVEKNTRYGRLSTHVDPRESLNMTYEITPLQRLILWALLARGGSCSQKELKPKLEKKDRDLLVRAGLISTEKGKRGAIALHVEDKGWHWASENMGAEISTRSNAGAVVLQDLLLRLGAFTKARNIALAEVLALEPQGVPTAATEDAVPRAADDFAAPREKIRAAFLDLTGRQFNTLDSVANEANAQKITPASVALFSASGDVRNRQQRRPQPRSKVTASFRGNVAHKEKIYPGQHEEA